MIKVYLASGWFNERDERILTKLEDYLVSMAPEISVYRPRKDGIELTPEDFHDHAKRKSVFDSNVRNIDTADLLVVNLDCGSSKLDTGTVWECARAVTLGIPVVIYNEVEEPPLLGLRMGNLVTGIGIREVHTVSELDYILRSYLTFGVPKYPAVSTQKDEDDVEPYPVFLRDYETSVEDSSTPFLATCIEHLPRLKVIDTSHKRSKSAVEDTPAKFYIIPTDSKDPRITWYMSTAYARGIPIFTYSSKGSPLNLMLIFSVVKHCVGISDLYDTLSQIQTDGIESFEEFNTDGIRVY